MNARLASLGLLRRWQRARLAPGLRRAGRLLALAAALAAVCALLLNDIVGVPGRVADDCKSYYLAGVAAVEGVDFYDVSALRALAPAHGLGDPVYPYLYPPPLAHAVSWLAPLSPRSVQLVGWGITVGSLCAALAVSVTALNARFALAALLLWLLNLRASVFWGQVNPLIAALLLLAAVCHARRADVASGALIGLAAAVKVTPALLLVHCWATRRYRAFAGFALVMALAVPLDAAGWLRFLGRLPVTALSPTSGSWNFSLGGFAARLSSDPAVTRLFPVAAAIALLLPVALRARRSPDERTARLLLLPLLVVMLIASPLAYAHHVLMLFPGALLAAAFVARTRPLWQLVGLLLLFNAASTDFTAHYLRAGTGPLGANLNLYALLALYAIGMALARPERRSEAPARGGREPPIAVRPGT